MTSPLTKRAVYADVRLQIDQLIAQAEPRLVVLASQLTESQIRTSKTTSGQQC